MVDTTENTKFLAAQRHAIEKSVYIASEKAHRNLRLDYNGCPSEDYFIYWIQSHAGGFREAWDCSVCKECKKIFECHDCLKDKCKCFDPDQ
jgi:hypothetical protein